MIFLSASSLEIIIISDSDFFLFRFRRFAHVETIFWSQLHICVTVSESLPTSIKSDSKVFFSTNTNARGVRQTSFLFSFKQKLFRAKRHARMNFFRFRFRRCEELWILVKMIILHGFLLSCIFLVSTAGLEGNDDESALISDDGHVDVRPSESIDFDSLISNLQSLKNDSHFCRKNGDGHGQVKKIES